MIKGFRHKGLADFFHTGSARKVQAKHAKRLRMILTMLNAATHARQMDAPGLRLHPPKAIGVTRNPVSAIVNGRAPVTPDMALRLASAFATEPELWVNMQAQYDLWTVSKQARPKVKVLVTKKAA